MGRADRRNTSRTTETITVEDYVAFFHQYFGSPTTLSSLLPRISNAAAKNTSWVVGEGG
jgi:hypothetical protein